MTRLYGRKAHLVVYTLSASGGAQALDLGAIEFDFQVNLKTSVRRDAKIKPEPNSAQVTVYKLSEATRNLIKAEAKGLEVWAGYGDDESLIFRGVIRNATSEYHAPDWQTTLYAGDAYKEYSESIFSRSYKKGTPVLLILGDIIKAFGLPPVIRYSRADVLPKGTVYDSRAKDVLTKLCRDYGLSWSISAAGVEIIDLLNPPLVNKARVCVIGDELLSGPVIEESTETLEITTVSAKGEETGTGIKYDVVVRRVSATLMLRPEIKVGTVVQFRTPNSIRSFSDIATQKLQPVGPQKYYIVDDVEHTGDNYGSGFETRITTREDQVT